jgi:hypothetical protein
MQLGARIVGGLKARRTKKTHHKGMKQTTVMKKASSLQETKQKGQVKPGTHHSDLAEGGNPKRCKEKTKCTKISSKVPSQPSSRFSMCDKQGNRQRSPMEADPHLKVLNEIYILEL